MRAARAPLLALAGITRRFGDGEEAVTVLRAIDLTIAAGEFVAIVGASGSGKSTLMNLLGCLDTPSTGRYTVGGIDTASLSPDALARLRRERFGFIFQRYHLLPHLSVAANVEVPAVYAGMPRAARRARALKLLARLGLTEHVGRRPNALSGGQQQRVSVARALMTGGEVILADEPTGALDSASGDEVLAILHELHALGHTIVVVTHDPMVARQAGRIVELRDGAIVRDTADRKPAGETPEIAAPGRAMTGERTARSEAPRRGAAFGRFLAACRMAGSALAAHRLRTLLTMLGIVIGILSVVSIVAIGEGAKRYMLEDLSRMGTHTIEIYPGKDWGDPEAASIRTLVPADGDALREARFAEAVTPATSRSLPVRRGRLAVDALVSGVSGEFFRVRGLAIAHGIAFGERDVRRYAQVAVIDRHARRALFGEQANPLGQIVLVGNVPCVVIGVTADRSGMFGTGATPNLWVPYSTAGARLFGQRGVDSLTVRIGAGEPAEAAEAAIVGLLTRRHGRKDFFTYNIDSVVKTAEGVGRTLTLLLTSVAVISLVVGGIGVMNIMLVSVAERTREIGIRAAVGARRGDLMQQFLAEAVLVCLAGGVLGVALSLVAGGIFTLFVDGWRMVYSARSVVAAFACSTLVGVLFGYVPARRAARLAPVDALARD
ncbi:MacB family efflux pump subunit [Trinickia caryophylli]|uniref:Pyoverdine export ATP-binding/permease protein PvdT n=1 Tax=Trinickia caryophylli TaxID=28094 RepID=A0A1X7H452_TRICW|nr:MacB family efflux pump subunit [Trinickia caryophylli]PMS09576.1 MacB family efflux pump subunit [Trinickia caryophylli]TRX17292.1 MacB family efflux pump subunit [Trinickia caryophylli]WQE11967.1 MacB family efflux pump subunit [Trinickia caryophylli]SMF79552.1 macrolide transport system ATP-binding/permease protein [Trinickia caryophylli]GLU35640.1 macrolide export ATP-binding/permease protein MacB [Trinickia caryophylli]